VIPAYNRAELLPRALRSVVAQTAQPAEVIVVDDGSEDGTAEVAEAFGVRVMRHERNRGESAARNTAIVSATQPWVALLDSDDEWKPNHLERVFSLREGHVLVSAATMAKGGASLNRQIFGIAASGPYVLRTPAAVTLVNCIPPSSTLLDRRTVLEAGGFDTSLPLCADLDMWLRILERGTGVASPAVGSIYYLHEGQVSGDSTAMNEAHRSIVASYRGRPWWSASLLHRYEGAMAWDGFRLGLRERDAKLTAGSAIRMASHPDRARGVVALLRWRRASRHLSALEPR
jgi:glycosyltransferase involved in cell wall biosynthesis